MKCNVVVEKNDATIEIAGLLDVVGAPILRDAVSKLGEEISYLVLDFKDVDYVSSAGIREILICIKKYGEENVFIKDVSDSVESVLQLCGFSKFVKYSKYQDPSKLLKLSFADFVKEKAKTSSSVKAIFSEKGDIYTWDDIDKCSQIMAKELSDLGVKQGSHVGLCSQNSINYIIAFYAIQKLGAFSQLINNQLKVDEIIAVLNSGDVEFFCYGDLSVNCEEFISNLKSFENNPIKSYFSISSSIDYKAKLDSYESVKNMLLPKIDSDMPAVMIFTSGSSGKPKGVLLSSYNILNAANNMGKYLNIYSSDKLCLILPLFHVFGLVPCLFAHAINDSMVMLPPSMKTSSLLEFIATHHCTHFNTVPTMMLAIFNNKDFTAEKLSSLKVSVLAGASATESQLIEFKKLLPNNHYIAAYGLSEMAPVTITNFDDSVEHITKTVGHAVEDVTIKIVDPNTGKEVKTGENGEILVQGFNLMIGYYNIDPSSQSIDENGFLHTGDVGHLDEDGYLYFVTRIKELIIRGGENIAPGEVASAISAFDAIADCKVFGIPHDFYGELVGACIVLKSGYEFNQEEMTNFLLTKLAKFKIPVHYEIYESFPLLQNGKIDAQSLKKDFLKKVEHLRTLK